MHWMKLNVKQNRGRKVNALSYAVRGKRKNKESHCKNCCYSWGFSFLDIYFKVKSNFFTLLLWYFSIITVSQWNLSLSINIYLHIKGLFSVFWITFDLNSSQELTLKLVILILLCLFIITVRDSWQLLWLNVSYGFAAEWHYGWRIWWVQSSLT